MAEIVIAGGGHTGLLAAIALIQKDFDVCVVDRTFEIAGEIAGGGGRSLALLAGSQKRIAEMGAWGRLRAIAEPVTHVDVRDPGTNASVRYRHDEVGVDVLAWGLRQSELRAMLLEHYRALGGRTVADRVTGLRRKTHTIELTLAASGAVEARLVIGADGRGSRIRELCGIGVQKTDFAQRAASFIVAHERQHRGTVIERFLDGGPLAVLPLRNRHCGITWVRGAESVIETDERLPAALADALGNRLGAMELASKVEQNPLGALHADNYVTARAALIGDAAHGAHPIHAQGFNMGVADVTTLARVLAQAKARGEDIGGACLRRYEAARRRDNAGRLRMTSSLNQLYASDNPALRPVRQALLTGLRTIGPLRRRAIRHGMRLSYDGAS